MVVNKIMKSLELYDSSNGEEFYTQLNDDDLFVSMHFDDKKSIGMLIKRKDLFDEKISKLLIEMQRRVAIDFNRLELKVIGQKKNHMKI